MTRSHHIRLLGLLLLATTLALTACRSSKRSTREAESVSGGSPAGTTTDVSTTTPTTEGKKTTGGKKTSKKESTIVAHLNDNRQTVSGIRGKMSISLQAGSTPLSASGTIKMKRDEIIQLSITALGLLELGRMELTPEYLFIQDRYHKRYIKAAWNEIPALQGTGVEFNTFQSLFWNELFVPGNKNVPAADDFEVTDLGNRFRMKAKEAPRQADLFFYTDEDKDHLYQTSFVSRDGGKVRFDALCTAWNKLAGKPFPAALRLIISVTKSYSADFTFNGLQVDESMGQIATSVSDGKYTRVSLDEILSGLHL